MKNTYNFVSGVELENTTQMGVSVNVVLENFSEA